MRRSIALLIMLTVFVTAQEEIKKDREPVFVLPDVVISGESDMKIGVEKKDLLPANYPMPPKETPLMEMEFIKGPYLGEEKRSPEMEKSEGKNRFGELTAYLGNYDTLYAKLTYGQQIEKLGFLVNVLSDRKNFFLQDSGYVFFEASGDFNYAVDNLLQAGLTLDYENEYLKTPYASSVGFDVLIKDFYTAYLRLSSVPLSNLNLNAHAGYVRSDISTFGAKHDEFIFGAKAAYEFMLDGKKHLPGLLLEFRNDSIYSWIYTASLEDRFRLDNIDLLLSVKSNSGWVFVNARAMVDIDGFTRLYAAYEPGRNYPRFKELYDTDVYLLNTALSPENVWFNLSTGVEHKLLKTIPLTLEFYRKEINDMVLYESAGNSTAPANLPKVSILGVNVKEEWQIMAGLTQKLSYSYTNAVNPDNAALNITYLPVHSGVLSGEYLLADWTFNADLIYRGEVFYSETLTAKLDSALILSAGIKKAFGENLTVFAKGENLLNREYQNIKDYTLPKAVLKLGLTYKF